MGSSLVDAKTPKWVISKLDSRSSKYIVIPSSVILDGKECEKLVTVFSYFFIKRGLDDTVSSSINMIAKWCGKNPNRSQRGISAKLLAAVNKLNEDGFISVSDNPSGANIVETNVNLGMITKLCQEDRERFATVYIDEILKIVKYDGLSSSNKTLDNDVLLHVFAYLRMMIYRRKSDPSATQYGDNDERRVRTTETYNCYIQDMAEELGLSPAIVSDAITTLREMELIYFEPLPRLKYDDSMWRTGHTVFCNWYKRESGYLVAEGSAYYEEEVKNRKKQLKFVPKND
jgi:hypothetical protein